VAPEEANAGRQAQRQAAPEEAEAGRPQAPARRPGPAAATTDRVCDPAKGKWLEEVPSTEKEKEKEKKKKKRASGEAFEFWEIGTSRAAPDSPAEEEPVRPKKRRLRRPTSREDGTTTISVDRNPARGPPTRTTVRIVPREGRAQPEAAPAPPPPPRGEVVVTMEEEPTTAAAAMDVDIPAEEKTLPEAEEQPVTAEEGTLPDAEERPVVAEEETLPEVEERPAQEREADPAAAPQNIQVPTWNLDERIPIAPQVWDADTPQISIGVADDGVEMIEIQTRGPSPHSYPRRSRGQGDGRCRHIGRIKAD
jgi:hypothetical protein